MTVPIHATKRLPAGRLVVALALLLATPAGSRAEGPAGATPIQWLADEAEGFARARQTGQPVLVDFWADWCGACAMLERTAFSDRRVHRAIEGFVAVRLDGSEGSPGLDRGRYDGAAERWQVRGLPTILLFDPRGRLLDRIEGVVGAGELLDRLRSAETRCRASLSCRRGSP